MICLKGRLADNPRPPVLDGALTSQVLRVMDLTSGSTIRLSKSVAQLLVLAWWNCTANTAIANKASTGLDYGARTDRSGK